MGYTDKAYACACESGFTGEQCERGKRVNTSNNMHEKKYSILIG